jgi:hypothetical protein
MENGRSPGGAVMAWTASRRVAPTASLLTLEQNSGQLGGTPEWLLPKPDILEMILPGDPGPVSASRSPADIAQSSP